MDMMRMLVQGYVWKGRMSNGAVFEWWTPMKGQRKQAREEIFAIANAWGDDDENRAYDPSDLERLWETKGVRSRD